MRWLLFFGRVAFICNIFFIACLVFRYNDIVTDQSLKGFVIVIGWLLAPIVNLIFVVSYLLAHFIKQRSGPYVQGWMFLFNFLILITQLIFIPFV